LIRDNLSKKAHKKPAQRTTHKHVVKKASRQQHAKAVTRPKHLASRAPVKRVVPKKVHSKVVAPVVEVVDNTAEVERVLAIPTFVGYMAKNVGSPSVEVLKLLVKASQTDEGIAARLDMKINEVRRMLNVMNGYGFLRYDTNKDNKGWLIFKWRIDRERLFEFEQNINKYVVDGAYASTNCNDFFFCAGCFESNKVVVPFDAAFELNFKCVGCGKALDMLSKEETLTLFVNK
jgi:transcription factor E